MIEFTVPEMSCGHCVGAITQAIKGVDPDARVDVSLAEKKVRVQSDAAREVMARALSNAGYEPAAALATPAPKRGGCCCR
jgi:copper chaperone